MISKDKFAHLHLHSQYSLLDGAIRIADLVDALPGKGMHAVAVTDHGAMFGTIPFYLQAMDKNIKPIIGSEFYIVNGSRLDKDQTGSGQRFHIVLLAENREGYQNLIKLSSCAYLEGFYYKPRIDKEILREHSAGIIALSGCLKGELNVHITHGNIEAAEEAALEYQDIFGKGNYFIELQRHGLAEQDANNKHLIDLARKLDIPLVATNDCHYLEKSDAEAHDVLVCIQTGSNVSDPERMRMETQEFYLKTPKEMLELFSDVPDACSNTVEIAKRCNLVIETGKLKFPVYEIPEDHTLDSYLEKVVYDGLEERMPLIKNNNPGLGEDEIRKIYSERLEEELAVIRNTGFPGYFLIVWDFIRHARKEEIPVGPGRGSGAGSLVAYVMRITDIDPILYGLLFQRFLNPDRVSPPDFDIDFCWRERPKVIDYVRDKYGRDSVAQIITFGTLGAKAAIKDVARAMSFPFDESNRITKMVPDELNITISAALEKSPDLQAIYKKDIRVKKLIDIASRLEGLIRHASTHAAGVVITDGPTTDYVPLYMGSKDEVTTQYAMGDIEQIGLLKMDFLGLRTLTVISDTVKMIEKTTGEKLNIDTIPLDDEDTYKLFQRGDTSGIFQFESGGMRDILRKVQPTVFNDLIALNALYRPGPLGSGMIDQYINRKHGKEKIEYPHPAMEKFLKETYGVIVYQEQVMQIASAMGGFSLGEADLLRRAMGKKKEDVMAAQRKNFIDGAREKKIDSKTAESVFDLMSHFAGYGFNKSHSTAYALLAYQTAYLKTKYPAHFMAALLTSEKENIDKVAKYIKECKEMGIEVTPPSINISYSDFTVAGGNILFGLSAIKGVGSKAVEDIINARNEEGRFTSIFDFCKRVNLRSVNKRVLEQLINSGAMDDALRPRAALMEMVDTALTISRLDSETKNIDSRKPRKALMVVLDKAMQMGQQSQIEKDTGQLNIFAEEIEDDNVLFEEILPQDFMPWNEKEVLDREKEALGFYVTGHPLSKYEKDLKTFTSYNLLDIKNLNSGDEIRVGGLITNVQKKFDKRNREMATVVLEDLYSSVTLIIFSSVFPEVAQKLQYEQPVLVKGKLDLDGNEPKIITNEISYLSDIKMTETSEIRIKLLLPGMDEELINKLDKLFQLHPGKTGVNLQLIRPHDTVANMRLNRIFSVKLSDEFIKAVEEIAGEGSIELIY